MDAPSVEDEQVFLCHPMKFTRDIQTAFTNGCGYLLHFQMKHLFSCGMMASVTQKAAYLMPESLGMRMPWTAGKALCACRDDVEKVGTEDAVAFQQPQRLWFAEHQ
jgi:hypothetical protein